MSQDKKGKRRGTFASAAAGAVSVGVNMMKEKFTELDHDTASKNMDASSNFPMIRLARGYEIEKVADKLTYPTSITWDDQGNTFIAEAGGTFLDEEDASARILRLDPDGQTTEIVNLDGRIYPAISGMTWHKGAFYITHRDEELLGVFQKLPRMGKSPVYWGEL